MHVYTFTYTPGDEGAGRMPARRGREKETPDGSPQLSAGPPPAVPPTLP